MKKIFTTLAVICIATAGLFAQDVRTAYFMEGSIARMSMNPAFRPNRGYIHIPAVGGLSLSVNTNGMTASSFLFPGEGQMVTFLDPSVSSADFLSGLKDVNKFGLDVNMPILGFGFHAGRSFWSFGVGLDFNAGFQLPKGLFEFLKVGTGVDGASYDLKDFSVGTNVYLNASLGYSRSIINGLNIGLRINGLIGVASAKASFEKFNMTLNANEWTVDAIANIDIATGLINIPRETINGKDYINFKGFGGGGFGIRDEIKSDITKAITGYGLTFDIGAEYAFLRNVVPVLSEIRVSAAVLDWGFVKWDKSTVTSGTSRAENVTFSGVDLSGEGANQSLNEITEQLKELANFEIVESRNFQTDLRATYTVGAEIALFKRFLSIGGMYMSKKDEFTDRSEISAIATIRPAKWLSIAASYTFTDYRNIGNTATDTFGAVVNFHTCWINLFVGTDYVTMRVDKNYIPISQSRMNVYVGLSIPLARGKYM